MAISIDFPMFDMTNKLSKSADALDSALAHSMYMFFFLPGEHEIYWICLLTFLSNGHVCSEQEDRVSFCQRHQRP